MGDTDDRGPDVRRGARAVIRRISRPSLVGALAATLLVTAGVGAQDAGGPIGAAEPVVYESLDGTQTMTLAIDELIDPFETGLSDIEFDRLDTDGERIVALRVRLDNTGPGALTYLPSNAIKLVVDGSLVVSPGGIVRGPDAREAEPDIPAGAVEPGASRSGLLFYRVAADSRVEAVVFTPAADRLVMLAGVVTAGGPAITSAPQGSTTDGPDDGGPGADRTTPDVSATENDDAPPVVFDIGTIAAGGAYEGHAFGHAARWDPAIWDVHEAVSVDGTERLVLRGDVFEIELEAFLDPGLGRCLAERIELDLDGAVGFDAIATAPAPTTSGRPAPDAGTYLVSLDAGGRRERYVRYVECRPLGPDGAAIRIVVTAPERFWDIDRQLAVAVLEAISPPPRTLPEAQPVEPDAEELPVEST